MPESPGPTLKRPFAWAGAHSLVYPGKSEAVRTRACLPQQATEPSLLTPQVCQPPALTETKEPAGGVDWPSSLTPQQAMEPSLLTPQVFFLPALTETKEPAGGVVSPKSLKPQQATEPSPLTPQVWIAPALTETKEPAGGRPSPYPL